MLIVASSPSVSGSGFAAPPLDGTRVRLDFSSRMRRDLNLTGWM
jgi:hypothetical protein